MNRKSLLELNILTAEGPILERQNLESVNVPLADGLPIGIKPGHAPLIAETRRGDIVYRTSKSEQNIECHAGILNIRDNVVTILTPGKVTELPPEDVTSLKNEYERLMRAILGSIQPDEDQ